jgi:dUTP pyrophosphatase
MKTINDLPLAQLPVKYKKLSPEARLMPPAQKYDAGHDIGFVETGQNGKKSGHIDEFGNKVYYTGIALEIGYIDKLAELGLVPHAFAFLKSGVYKVCLALTNGVGVVDFGHRGEIVFKFKPALLFSNLKRYGINILRPWFPSEQFLNIKDWVGQLVFMPAFNTELTESIELTETDRGSKGYGDATKERDGMV